MSVCAACGAARPSPPLICHLSPAPEMSDVLRQYAPEELVELLLPLATDLEQAAERFELNADTVTALGILVVVVLLKIFQKKPDRSAQEALDAATPPDLRSLAIAGGMLAFYLICAPFAFLAATVPQAQLIAEDELLALALEPRTGLGLAIQVVVTTGSGWPAAAVCAAVVGDELASGCVERPWESPSSAVVEADLLPLVDGVSGGLDVLPLVLFPCTAADVGRTTVTVGAANIAWACLPVDAAARAAASAVVALRTSLTERAAGVQTVADVEAAAARLAPTTRVVLTLAIEDGQASDTVSGWEGGAGAVYDAIAPLSAAVGLALGGRRAQDDPAVATVAVRTESHVARHVSVDADGAEGAEAGKGRRRVLPAEAASRLLELPDSYTPGAALEERRWSFVAVLPSDQPLSWDYSRSNQGSPDASTDAAAAAVVPGRGGVVALAPAASRDGTQLVDPAEVLAVVAEQCRQLLGLPSSAAAAAAADDDDATENADGEVSVAWATGLGTAVMSETELSLVCLAREGALVHRRVLALLHQLLHLAHERDDVFVPPHIAEAADAAVRALRQSAASTPGDGCTARLALQLDALRLMTVRVPPASTPCAACTLTRKRVLARYDICARSRPVFACAFVCLWGPSARGAQSALADPQLLPQAHIPKMHRIAVWMPLLLPLTVPVFGALLHKALLRFLRLSSSFSFCRLFWWFAAGFLKQRRCGVLAGAFPTQLKRYRKAVAHQAAAAVDAT